MLYDYVTAVCLGMSVSVTELDSNILVNNVYMIAIDIQIQKALSSHFSNKQYWSALPAMCHIMCAILNLHFLDLGFNMRFFSSSWQNQMFLD